MVMTELTMIGLGTLLGILGTATPLIKWLNSIENTNAINGEKIKGLQIAVNDLRSEVKEIHKFIRDGKNS